MLAQLLISLAAASQLPALISCDASGPIHNPLIRAKVKEMYDAFIKLHAWNETSGAFSKLNVSEHTDFINANQHFWKVSAIRAPQTTCICEGTRERMKYLTMISTLMHRVFLLRFVLRDY